MKKIKVNIFDKSFLPDESMVRGRIPTYWQYIKDGSGEINLYTHFEILSNLDKILTSKKINYGACWESAAIIPSLYKELQNTQILIKLKKKFQYIFTFYKPLLDLDPIFQYCPAYGQWITTPYGGGAEYKIYDKSKLVSMVCSDKLMCPGHHYRHSVMKQLKDMKVDLYGAAAGKPFEKSIDAIAPYMFHICMENSAADSGYFTEKVLNTFCVGTIPVFWGHTPSLYKFFNPDGVIELPPNPKDLLERLTPELWASKRAAIEDNLIRVREWGPIEDYIVSRYFQDNIVE